MKHITNGRREIQIHRVSGHCTHMINRDKIETQISQKIDLDR